MTFPPSIRTIPTTPFHSIPPPSLPNPPVSLPTTPYLAPHYLRSTPYPSLRSTSLPLTLLLPTPPYLPIYLHSPSLHTLTTLPSPLAQLEAACYDSWMLLGSRVHALLGLVSRPRLEEVSPTVTNDMGNSTPCCHHPLWLLRDTEAEHLQQVPFSAGDQVPTPHASPSLPPSVPLPTEPMSNLKPINNLPSYTA